MYTEDQLLPISGLQHYAFCKRQCGLIHLEQQWKENLATTQGKHLHKKVHTPGRRKFKSISATGSLAVHSYELGLFGLMDLLVESQVDTQPTKWIPREFKRGRPKKNPCDRIQLCAQAICLEEMADKCPEIKTMTPIQFGQIFYGKTRRLCQVEFTAQLRQLTRQTALEFHEMIRSGRTPPPETGPKCKKCSLKEICMPDLAVPFGHVHQYLAETWNGLDPHNICQSTQAHTPEKVENP